MPIIREYQQTVRPAGPGAVINAPLSIADAAAAPGRAAQQALSQAAEIAHAFGERVDKSRVAKDLAEARADLTIELQNDIQSGAAATPDWNFDEKVAKRLEKTQGGYHTGTGVSMSTAGASAMTAEFRIQANHYQTVAIGQQAALGYKQAMEAHQKTLQADPMQYDSVRAEVLTILHDPNGPYARDLSAQKIAELDLATRNELAINAVRGVINTRQDGPEAAKELIANGIGPAKDLTAGQQTQLVGEADRAANAREIDAERLLRFEERKSKKEHLAIGDEFFARNANGALSMRDIVNSSLPWQEKRYWEAAIKEKAEKTDPRRVNDWLNKIIRGDITRDDQLPPLGNGVTYQDRQHMLTALKNAPLGEAMSNATAAAERIIRRDIILNTTPEKAEIALLEWKKALSANVQKKLEAKEDPIDLITPGHKDNMLDRKKIAAYAPKSGSMTAEMKYALESGQQAAKAEFSKPGHGALTVIKSPDDVAALPSGTYFVIPAVGGRPPELRIKE